MPYRRLPTTDKARLRALETAINKVNEVDEQDIPFAKHFIGELKNTKTRFENLLKHYEWNIQQQSENNNPHKTSMETARMYLSHFIQVFYLACERKEIGEGIKFYGKLCELEGKLPPLNTSDEIIEWGEIIVEGEQNRIRQGGNPIYCPSIAVVKCKLEDYKDVAIFQQNLKRNTARALDKMQELRKSTNDFIAQLWTEIESQIEKEVASPEQKREKAEEYGIVYVLRRKERKELEKLTQVEEIIVETQPETKEKETTTEIKEEIREKAPKELLEIITRKPQKEKPQAKELTEILPEKPKRKPQKAAIRKHKPEVIQQDLFFQLG